ncbi:hypothetical protein AVEN_19455-1 [Araneus ventricosus]|uniref:Uncharacterized protein n=1 Tax=Araneus ventricosus TaxID=182803 RepID=A0A4Y2C6I3_ARAVE|nr:hypothetical protein AVEN_19455-1 [Araneus ventricosus]
MIFCKKALNVFVTSPFPFSSSLRVVGDMNGRPFISHFSPKGPFNDHPPNCLLPLSEQQPAEIRPTSIEFAWPDTAGLGVKVLIFRFEIHTGCVWIDLVIEAVVR